MRSARFRLLVLVFAALALVAGACADDGEVGGPAVGGSAAAVVGDVQLTHADLADLVDRWAANPEFLAVAAGVSDVGTPARRPSTFVNFVLNFWMQSEQGRVVSGGVVSDTETLLANLREQIPEFGAFDEDFQNEIARSLDHQNALRTAMSQGGPVDLPPVEVSSRYGEPVDFGGGVIGVDAPVGPLAGTDTLGF